MKMRLADLQKKILTAIKTKLSHKDLCNLCTYNEIPSAGLKRNIQVRLELFMQNQSYNQLLLINNKIDEFLTKVVVTPTNQVAQDIPKYDNSVSAYKPDTITDVLLSQSPIKLDEELTMINRNLIVVVQFTTYPSAQTPVPTQAITGINERAHSVRLPNMLPHVPVQISPFYCCPTCLHPLSLLIPQTMPNVPQNNRITSHSSIQFILSDDAFKLIARNSVTNNGKKTEYKWQALLRFVAIDPTRTIPTPGQSVTQVIPPYLNITTNNEMTPLWDVLPSNCKAKEGKRHPKAVNITDKLNCQIRAKNGYRQNILIDWWQTPGVFQYYYVGVYLERKLSVREILDLFATNRHVNIFSVEDTLALIKSKLSGSKGGTNDDDDDLVVSSVLPISLSCPVGRSRIEIPIRTVNCQHLQCFDAHLFLSMNERRSIWKCPVCESSATPNELFCDKYFQEILQEFKDSDEVNDINVHSDGSYVPALKNKDEKADQETKPIASTAVNDMIVLDSDEEGDSAQKVQTPQKLPKGTRKAALLNSATERNKQKTNHITEAINQRINSTNVHNAAVVTETQSPASPSASTNSITIGPSNIRITAPLSSAGSYQTPRQALSLSSNTFVIPPPTFHPATSLSHTPSSLDQFNIIRLDAPPLTTTASTPAIPTISSIFTQPIPSTTSAHTSLSTSTFHVSSLIQSPSISSIIQSPLHNLISTPYQGSVIDPIPAPSKDTSIFASLQTINTPILTKTAVTLPSSDQIQALIDNAKRETSNPITVNSFESMIKINTSKFPNGTIHTINQSLDTLAAPPSIPMTFSDMSRNITDVIKAPPTNITAAVELLIADKTLANRPISCPTIIVDDVHSFASVNNNKQNAFTKPQEVQRDSLKRNKSTSVAPKPAGAIDIPAVSIDLTEDDDDEEMPLAARMTAAPATATHRTQNHSNLKWYSANDPILRSSHVNIHTNKFAQSQSSGGRPGLGHFKTHRVDARKMGPIDLTADDDDEDECGVVATPPAHKRMRVAIAEEGQINDSDDDDDVNCSSPSSTSTSSVDSVHHHARKLNGRTTSFMS